MLITMCEAFKEMLAGNMVTRWCGSYVLDSNYILWRTGDESHIGGKGLQAALFDSVSSPQFNDLSEKVRKAMIEEAS